MQKTFAKKIEIKGIGLHSGIESTLVLKPAPENTGIVFIRTDLPCMDSFSALYSNVIDTRNCTCLGNSNKNIVSTIEHLMATLAIIGVDNAIIEINNPEIPIMDGSADVFLEKIQKNNLIEQNFKRKYLKIVKKVEYEDNNGASIVVEPADNFYINFTIDFPSKIVGHQTFDGKITPEIFARYIAPARTFCEKYQVDYLKSIGLIKGGSLENAIVLDGENILNEGGFRVENECVNHKVLDCIGDMFTSGYRLKAKITAIHSGHFHNNEILKKIFSNKENYEIIEE